jgi:hypothetical protein
MADEEPAPGQPDPDLNAELFGSDDDDDQQQLQPNDQQPDGAQDITGAGDSAPGQVLCSHRSNTMHWGYTLDLHRIPGVAIRAYERKATRCSVCNCLQSTRMC